MNTILNPITHTSLFVYEVHSTEKTNVIRLGQQTPECKLNREGTHPTVEIPKGAPSFAMFDKSKELNVRPGDRLEGDFLIVYNDHYQKEGYDTPLLKYVVEAFGDIINHGRRRRQPTMTLSENKKAELAAAGKPKEG